MAAKAWSDLSPASRRAYEALGARIGLTGAEAHARPELRAVAGRHARLVPEATGEVRTPRGAYRIADLTPRSPWQVIRNPQRYEEYTGRNRDRLRRLAATDQGQRIYEAQARERREAGAAPISLGDPSELYSSDYGDGHLSRTFPTMGDAQAYIGTGNPGFQHLVADGWVVLVATGDPDDPWAVWIIDESP